MNHIENTENSNFDVCRQKSTAQILNISIQVSSKRIVLKFTIRIIRYCIYKLC